MIVSFPRVSNGMPREKYAFHRAARDKTNKRSDSSTTPWQKSSRIWQAEKCGSYYRALEHNTYIVGSASHVVSWSSFGTGVTSARQSNQMKTASSLEPCSAWLCTLGSWMLDLAPCSLEVPQYSAKGGCCGIAPMFWCHCWFSIGPIIGIFD